MTGSEMTKVQKWTTLLEKLQGADYLPTPEDVIDARVALAELHRQVLGINALDGALAMVQAGYSELVVALRVHGADLVASEPIGGQL